MAQNRHFKHCRRRSSGTRRIRFPERLESRRLLAVLAVPSDFSTIQDAIDNARDGDTVQIADGLYEENLDLTRMGSAIGRGAGGLRIQGDSQAVVVRAPAGAALFNSAPFVGDLRVQSVTLESPVASGTTAGIVLDDVAGKIEFRDLLFRNLTGAALHVEHIDGELFVTDSVFEATGGQDRADAMHILDLTGTGVIHSNEFNNVTGTAIRVTQTGSAAVLMIADNEITGDASFFQTTGDGLVVSVSGDARLDLSLDQNRWQSLSGRGIAVQVADQSQLQTRWTKNTLQQIRGESALQLQVEDSGAVALAVIDNSILDAFGDGMSVTLVQAADVRALILDNLFLGIGDGDAKTGVAIGTAASATGELDLRIDNNTIDTIAGDGLRLIVDGAVSASVVFTNNFLTGTNTTGGTDAVVLQSAGGSSATVRATLSGNQVLDPVSGAFRLSNLGGSLALTGNSPTASEELAATNQGEPVNIDGTVPMIPADSVDAVIPLLLGDFVWLDANGNGVADSGEPGQAFVRVNLSGTDSAGEAVERSTLTDSDGRYYFSALLPGDYLLDVETPLGFRLTAANQDADDAIDSDFDRTTKSVQVSLSAAMGDLTVDAGLEQTWQNPVNRYDVNGDGFVSPIDVLQLINELNDNGSYELPVPFVAPNSPPPYLDVDGDGSIAPIDVLQVINVLNEAADAEGEGAVNARPRDAMPEFIRFTELSRPSATRRSSKARLPVAQRGERQSASLARDLPHGPTARLHRVAMFRIESNSTLNPQLVDRVMMDTV